VAQLDKILGPRSLRVFAVQISSEPSQAQISPGSDGIPAQFHYRPVGTYLESDGLLIPRLGLLSEQLVNQKWHRQFKQDRNPNTIRRYHTTSSRSYLILSRGHPPVTIRLVNQALRIHKAKKTVVHRSIRTWADGLHTFTHLDADVVIKKIADIISENSVNPEQWEMREEDLDEAWMTMDALRDL
jgi:hypothetical protein